MLSNTWADRGTRDVYADYNELTLSITTNALFGVDMSSSQSAGISSKQSWRHSFACTAASHMHHANCWKGTAAEPLAWQQVMCTLSDRLTLCQHRSLHPVRKSALSDPTLVPLLSMIAISTCVMAGKPSPSTCILRFQHHHRPKRCHQHTLKSTLAPHE